MKLTTTKISIPVLMMMLFQSGHGMNDWFWQASELFVSGQTAQAVRIVHQNDPNFFRITDPSKVSPEIQAIIDGTEDRINGWWDSIKAKVADFVPRQGADASFQDRIIDEFNLLLTENIDHDAVELVLSSAIVDNFYANVGFLDHDEAVAAQVTDVMSKITATDSVWKNSDVPALVDDQIPADLLGTDEDEPDAGTIKGFLKTAGDNWDTNWDHLRRNTHYSIGALTIDEESSCATLQDIISAATSGEEPSVKEQAIYNILVNRADEVRGADIPSIADSVVPWGSENAKEAGDNAAWKSSAASFIGAVWQADQTPALLKEAIYNDSALTLATGKDTEDTGYGYEDSDELTYYLSLFGNRSIDGNEELPLDDKEIFLQSILNKIEADIVAQWGEAAGDPGTEDRWDWVHDGQNSELATNIVEQAVYSVFGDKYVGLLRHTESPIAARDLFDAVTVGGVDEREEAEAVAVEGFEEGAVDQIVEWLNDIKEATPAQ